MKPFSPQITIVTIITIIALVRATDEFFEACEPQRLCGGQEISFPFYINGVQEPFCGYPGFDISCHDNDQPVINLSGDDYVIHKIFYHNQSLIVSNAAFSKISDAGSCFPSSVKNLSLPADHYRFTLSSNQTRVFLLYDFCPSDKNRSCSAEKNDTNNNHDYYHYSVMVLPESRAVELSRNDSCGAVVEAPVLDRSLQGNRGIVGDFREVLRGGFMMNWTASGCGFCESTGGKCGFNYDSFHFKCFCPDRPHSARCGPPGT